MQKAPEGVRGLPHFLAGSVHQSSGGSPVFLDGNFLFRAEPIFLVVAVLATAGFVECVCAFSDSVFEFLWFVYRGWWFRRGRIHGETPWANRTPGE